MNELRIKRAYQAASDSDGRRILVDRIWPRGMTRDRLRLAEWLKDIAPGADLRRWFKHDPAKWDEFRAAYIRELDGKERDVEQILDWLEDGPVTLVYGARNEEMNNAVVLKQYLEEKMRERRIAASPERFGRPDCFLRPSAGGKEK